MSRVKDKQKIESRNFFLRASLIILASFLAALILASWILRPSPQDLASLIAKTDLDSQELSFSSYKILKDQPKSFLGQARDLGGQTYYIKNSTTSLVKLGFSSLLILLLINLLSYKVLKAYSDRMRDRTLKPVHLVSQVITDILSGRNNQADLDKVMEDIKPIFQPGSLSSEEIEASITRLFKAEKNRREFTANVTHELKTPLTSINGYAEMIASGLVKEEDSRTFATIINSEGNRLLEMIDEIIRLSRYESQSRSDMDIERIDLGQEVSNIAFNMQTYAKTKGIDLSYTVQKVMAPADSAMVYEMLTNLISNAIKYNTPPGKVEVTVKNSYPFAEIRVKDDGIGIGEENLDRIFERFYMVNRNSNKTTGTGLGLSLVKHIVESHKGTIKVKSTLGQGSEFTVLLPMFGPEKMEELD